MKAKEQQLTHVDEQGAAHMVNVGHKPASTRIATAAGWIRMAPATLQLIQENALKKGDALAVARVAGIQAAKETSRTIPLCHPLSLTHVRVTFELEAETSCIHIQATCETQGQTGVEMEALCATNAAALTLYDMAKGVDKTMVIEGIRVIAKSGGESADSYRDPLEEQKG